MHGASWCSCVRLHDAIGAGTTSSHMLLTLHECMYRFFVPAVYITQVLLRLFVNICIIWKKKCRLLTYRNIKLKRRKYAKVAQFSPSKSPGLEHRGSFPIRGLEFSLYHQFDTDFVANPVSHPVSTGVNQPVPKADHTSYLSPRLKMLASPCLARPQVADGGDGLLIWRVAANILNKHKRWSNSSS
jgi:hypothetical protein